jgi:hypothetical protein
LWAKKYGTSTLQPGPRPERFSLVWPFKTSSFWENAFLTMMRLKEQCAPRGSNSNQKEFYAAAGFQGLVKWWDKCLNLYGDYVE